MLGAIVATTEPVAVVGVFREVGAPKRLTTLVEGESLFNDAASISLYSVLLTVLYGGGDLSIGKVFYSFVFSFLGGGAAGFLMGRLASGLFVWLRGDRNSTRLNSIHSCASRMPTFACKQN